VTDAKTRVDAASWVDWLGLRPEPAAAEPPPETFTLRIQRPVKTLPGVCVAPQLVADEMLKLEGFH